MSVLLIVEISAVTDSATYAEDVRQAPGTVEKFGGRYLARGERVESLGGDWLPERVVILEFPSWENLMSWQTCPEYKALAPLRLRSTSSRAIAVEGI